MVGIQEKGSAEQPTATMNTECSSPAPAHAGRVFSTPMRNLCRSEEGCAHRRA